MQPASGYAVLGISDTVLRQCCPCPADNTGIFRDIKKRGKRKVLELDPAGRKIVEVCHLQSWKTGALQIVMAKTMLQDQVVLNAIIKYCCCLKHTASGMVLATTE